MGYRGKSLPLKPIALEGASHELASPIALSKPRRLGCHTFPLGSTALPNNLPHLPSTPQCPIQNAIVSMLSFGFLESFYIVLPKLPGCAARSWLLLSRARQEDQSAQGVAVERACRSATKAHLLLTTKGCSAQWCEPLIIWLGLVGPSLQNVTNTPWAAYCMHLLQ